MTMFEKLSLVLSDGQWHSTEELVREVGIAFLQLFTLQSESTVTESKKRRSQGSQCEYRMLIIAKTAS
jgi:hypothetical protein